MIRDGLFAPGQNLASEQTLSESLGLSRGTVRQAIDLLVATGELTRRAHSRPVVGMPKDRSPEARRTDVYVWVSHPISDRASLMFIRGVSLGLKGTAYRMVVREPTRFYGGHVPADERQLFSDLLDDPSVAGVIVQRDPCGDSGEAVRDLLRSGRPVVFVDSPPPEGVDSDYVGSANLVAARDCVEHLVELGHERIACLVESQEPEVIGHRVQGYWRAMRQAGIEGRGACLDASVLPPTASQVRPGGRFAPRCAPSGPFLEWAQRLVEAVLSMPERPTALFVDCDVLALSVAALLEGAGLRIPEDVSIAGFDWLARWDSDQTDDLTTAAQDFEGFGRHAANLLIDRLEGDASPPRRVLLPAPLVVRSSTAFRMAPAPSADSLGDAALLNP